MLTSFIFAAIVSTQTFTKITPAGEIKVTITRECDKEGCISSYKEEPVETPTVNPHGDAPEDFTIPESDRQ